MTIKQQGGIFGRNPTFNDVDVEGTLNIQGSASFSEGITVTSASRITGTDDAVPVLDLRANNTGGGTKNTLRFFDDDGSADNGQQAGRIEFYTNDNTNKGIHSYINSETNTTGYGTIKVGTGLAGSAADRLTIASGGNVTVNTGNLVIGTSGQGIDFSATSGTGTSELFDDYEEGTWTPVVADASSGGNAGTAATAQGEYTKVGNLVYAKCALVNINTTGLTAATALFVRGLPYTSVDTAVTSRDVGSCVFSGNVTFTGFVVASIPDNNSAVRFVENASGASFDFLNVSDFASGTADIYFSVTYRAA